jgi:hypothetical protein
MWDLGGWTSFQTLMNKARVMPETSENKGSFRERFGKLIPEVLEEWRRCYKGGRCVGIYSRGIEDEIRTNRSIERW